jgi:hypothetical protein
MLAYDTEKLMKKIVLGVVAVGVLYLLFRWAFWALASEETRIRWLIQEMADDFNRSRPRACAEGLADDFRDDGSRVGKEEVTAYLLHLFLAARDPKTKEFLYRVEVPDEGFEVKVEPGEPPRARANLVPRFQELRSDSPDGAARPIWEVRLEAWLTKTDDGWKVSRSHYETVSGKPPQ